MIARHPILDRHLLRIPFALALALAAVGCGGDDREVLPDLGPLPDRVLRFPDSAVGTVRVRDWKGPDDLVWSHDLFGRRADPWRVHSPAEGEVRIPSGKVVLVETEALGEETLARLEALPPEQLFEVRLLKGAEVRNVAELARLQGVRRLDLRGTLLDAEALSALAAYPQLEALYLGETGLGDADLVRLKPLTRLALLDLNGLVGVTDRGVESLSSLKSLRFLDIRNTAITYPRVRALQKALPLCRILTTARRPPPLRGPGEDRPVS